MEPQSSSRISLVRDSEVNVELYECGCKVRSYKVDTGEWEADPPEKRITVRELEPCAGHNNNGHSVPPEHTRLVTVFGEHESYLNE